MTSTSSHGRPARLGAPPRRALAALVTAALGLSLSPAWAPSPAVAAQTTAQQGLTQGPGISVTDGIVTIKIPASVVDAEVGTFGSAVLEGDLAPGANVAEIGLGRNGDDYVSTIGPLPPGLYRYRIRADDLKIGTDTTNPNVVSSDPTWRTFFVPGKATELLGDAPGGKRGAMNHLEYRGGEAHVWTPAGYDRRRHKPYPVLFLNSGKGQDSHDWLDLGKAGQIIDNLTAKGQAESMVVVLADDDQKGLKDLGRAVERRFNVSRDAGHRAVAGVDSGADEALRATLDGHAEYGYVGAFSSTYRAGRLHPSPHRPGPAAHAPKLLRLYTGNVTDEAYNPTLRLMRDLDRAHVRYEFDGVNADNGGNWTAWRENLQDFVPRLFRPVRDHGRSAGHLPLTKPFTTPPSGTPTPWLHQDANGDGFLTVETGTDIADAKHVTLWGNWAPNGAWVNLPMEKVGNRWRATVGPLKPWFYYYKFLVDLQSVKDAANPTKVTTEPTWSTFLVPGERSRLLADVPRGQGGTVDELTYDSKVAGETRSAYVWTPPGYDAERAEPYPVLYLQHGGGQHYTDWLEMGRAKQILDNLSRDKKIVPMVVVMGEGSNVSDFTPELRENIAPAARAKFNIASDPAHQALAGLSMGGFQTYWLMRDHPGEFAWIGTFSSAIGFPGQPIDGAGYDAAKINAGTKLLQIYVGDQTDFVHPFAIQTMLAFDKIGVHYQFDGETPGPHGWDAWQKNLIDFAPRLFR